MFIKNLKAMGKANKKLGDLQDLNQLQKEDMQSFLGGKENEEEPKKKRWLSFCGGILQQ